MKYEFTVTYFKPSGKYYTDTVWITETEGIGANKAPYMETAVSRLRGLRDAGGQGAMPGLSEQSEGWDGPILITHEDGYPCLILPKEQ